MSTNAVDDIASSVINNPNTTAAEAFEALRIWGEATFGDGSAKSLVKRAYKEMGELLIEAEHGWTEKAVEEAADVIGVLTRAPGLWQALVKKMNVNFEREWDLKGDGTGYHIPKDQPVRENEPPSSEMSPASESRQEAMRRLALATGLDESYVYDSEWWLKTKFEGDDVLLDGALQEIQKLLDDRAPNLKAELNHFYITRDPTIVQITEERYHKINDVPTLFALVGDNAMLYQQDGKISPTRKDGNDLLVTLGRDVDESAAWPAIDYIRKANDILHEFGVEVLVKPKEQK